MLMWHNFILGPNPDFISSVRQVVNVLFSIVDTIDYLAQFNVLFPTRDLDKWDKRSTQLWMYGLIVSCSIIWETFVIDRKHQISYIKYKNVSVC